LSVGVDCIFVETNVYHHRNVSNMSSEKQNNVFK